MEAGGGKWSKNVVSSHSDHLLSVDYVPGIVMKALHRLSDLLFPQPVVDTI